MKLVLFFGSIEEYGRCSTPFKETYAKPISYYGKYKLKSFNKVNKIIKKKKMNFIWIRPSLTFGENDNKQRFMGHIINSIKENKVINISPSNQKRDYLLVHDLCDAILEIIKNYSKKYNCIVNISAENYINLNKIPMIFEKLLKRGSNLNYIIKILKVNLLNSNKKLFKLFPYLKFHFMKV